MIDVKNLNPHIVREFTVGHTRIRIADDCCRDKTPEEVEQILHRVARIAQTALTAAAIRESEQNTEKIL